jgi:hypothetical protein
LRQLSDPVKCDFTDSHGAVVDRNRIPSKAIPTRTIMRVFLAGK